MNTNDVNVIIDNICNKLGTTVEAVVPEYTKYMIASKLVTLITGVVITFIAANLTRMMLTSIKKRIAEYKEEYDGDDWFFEEWAIPYTVGGIALIFVGAAGIVTLINGLDIIPWIVSPQGAFIADMMSKFSK